MHRLSDWLYKLSSWPAICIATIAYGLFLSQVMAPHAAEMQSFAGQWGAPDGHFFYSPEKLYAEVENWGDGGRQHYINFRLGLDPLWALTYTAFIVSITSVALRRALSATNPRRRLNLVALAPMGADLLENLLGIVLMSKYPVQIELLAWLMAATSAFKWLTLVVAHLIMLYAVFAAVSVIVRDRSQMFHE
ncbi:MAG: hypothetical protein P8Y61_12575 [Gammaproteobacteria bacterium]|jgi:hypothetical protein